VTRVVRIRHRTGHAVDGARLERLLRDELRTPSLERVIAAPLRRVLPRITTGELARIHHTYVSVDRGTFTLRLFRRLRLTRRYRVAVGAAGFETPRGLRRVLSKQVNPAWTAPNRPWAGALAGQTIPPGDPRNPLRARFIGLGDGIGIHGTSEEWSIGTRASHGCIRMRVGDVKDLYRRVPLGTPVRIR
jgi:lipoprotein-anchoring transpeptidase ErfK/SrfK